MKLQEFFTQQFDTSKRALSTWGPGPYLPPKTPLLNTEKGAAELCKQEHFRVFCFCVGKNEALGEGSEMICNSNKEKLSTGLSAEYNQTSKTKNTKGMLLKASISATCSG